MNKLLKNELLISLTLNNFILEKYSPNYSNEISFIIKLDSSINESKLIFKLERNELNLNEEKIQMISFIYKDLIKGEYLDKFIDINIYSHSNEGVSKEEGLIRLNCCDYIDSKNSKKITITKDIINQESTFKGKLTFQFNYEIIKENKEKNQSKNDIRSHGRNKSNNDSDISVENISKNNSKTKNESNSLLQNDNSFNKTPLKNLFKIESFDWKTNINKYKQNKLLFSSQGGKNFDSFYNFKSVNSEIESLKVQLDETDNIYFEKYKENIDLKKKK